MDDSKSLNKAKNHFFNALFPSISRELAWLNDFSPTSSGFEIPKSSNISIYEDGNTVVLEAALPGVSKDKIEVNLDKDSIWIKGSAENQEEDKKRHYHCRSQQSFSYHVTIPQEVNGNKEPKASYKDGILKVIFEKQQAAMPKKITICDACH